MGGFDTKRNGYPPEERAAGHGEGRLTLLCQETQEMYPPLSQSHFLIFVICKDNAEVSCTWLIYLCSVCFHSQELCTSVDGILLINCDEIDAVDQVDFLSQAQVVTLKQNIF